MPAQLILAPIGAGKTEAVIRELARTLDSASFPSVWALLASTRQENAFRERLAGSAAERAVYFHIEFFNFYTLYARLLDSAGQPQRELDDTSRRRLLRVILGQLSASGQLELYHPIATTPGFVQMVAQFIYELKQNLVTPLAFERAARVGSAKDRDLHRIYDAYQRMLQQYSLVDREGVGWLALEALQSSNRLAQEVELLVVDGFDQFNWLQARLLAALSGRVRRMIVTLPWLAAPGTAAGRRFEQARQRLQAAFEDAGQPLLVETLTAEAVRPPALADSLDSPSPPRPSDGCLRLIEAPDAAQEAAAVLRRVKRLLRDGCRPDDVLIAVRDWEQYGRPLVEQGRAYGLPLALHYGERLADNPAIIALLNLLLLPGTNYRRRDLLDVLRSPYFEVPGLSQEAVAALARISQKRRVIADPQAWLDAVRTALPVPVDDDEDGAAASETAVGPEVAQALEAWFAALTPPPLATPADYIAWLEDLIGRDEVADPDDEADTRPVAYSLRMLARVRQGRNERDLAALAELKRILRSLLAAQTLSEALGQDPRVTWDDFLSELRAAIGAASVQRSPHRDGRVLVTTVTDARGLPHRHVFLLGLSEGIFPAPAPDDYLYLDSERRRLTASGVYLETQAERSADESLFVEIVGLAGETLTLSRPTVKDGKPWPESHLWRMVTARFTDADACLERIRPGEIPPAALAAALDEVLLAVAAGLNRPEPEVQVARAYNWLIDTGNVAWRQVRHGRQMEMQRLSRRPHDRYSGRLEAAHSVAWAAEQLGPARVWSASQFNDFGLCGFQFFARRLLELEALEEPEEGLDSAQFGTVHHDILEQTYRRLGPVTIGPESLEEAQWALAAVADEVFAGAPERLGFRPSKLWEYEKQAILTRLRRVIELDFSAKSPVQKELGDGARQSYRQELAFDLPLVDVTLDGRSETLRVRGRIDRIDRCGDRVLVVDYKTSTTAIPKQAMQEGRHFQMLVYLLAAQRLLDQDPAPDAPRQVVGGLFWHIGKRQAQTSGMVTPDDPAVADSLAHLAQHLQRGRSGNFAVQPARLSEGRCSKGCVYSQLCRVSVTHRFKREAPDEPHA